jgi:FkbM family methyltransferase
MTPSSGFFPASGLTPQAAASAIPFTEFYGPPAALPLTIRTSGPQESCAVEWKRSARIPATALLGIVTVDVLEGAIAVGVLETRGNVFADEVLVNAGTETARVQLVVPSAEDLGAFVVRNMSSEGGSRAIVRDIRFVPLVDPEESARAPLLSAPVPVPGWSRYYGTEEFTPVERLRAARFDRIQDDSVLRWSDGLVFPLRPGDQMSREVYVSGTYEPNMLCVLRKLAQPGDTFIDVGGNAGLVSLAAACWIGREGRVHVFEPSTREYRRLLDTIARNRLDRVSAHPVALGTRHGTGALNVASGPHTGLNTFGSHFPYSGISVETTEQVDVRTLDEVVEQEAIGRIAAIKIDVEGMELDVLRGAQAVLARDRPALVIEVLESALEACGATVEALDALLKSSGYTLWGIRENAGLRPLQSLRESLGDNVVALAHQL